MNHQIILEQTIKNTNDVIDEEEEIEVNIITRLFLFSGLAICTRQPREPPGERMYNSSLTGYLWLKDLLEQNNPTRFHNAFRMSPTAFLLLCNLLHNNYQLKSTLRVKQMESVTIFIYMVATGSGYRNLCERFQRSLGTLNNHFYRVLEALERMAPDFLCHMENLNTAGVPIFIRQNDLYFPTFKDCVGAIDGTHVDACPPQSATALWCGRKGVPTQNVLGVCDFHMRFVYISSGYEGRVHDTRVLARELNAEHGLFPNAPTGKYYLADSGYPNMRGLLTPYKGQTYHFQEFRGGRRPRNEKEKFNKTHSSLRSVIERTFGIFKKRFKILKSMPAYPMKTQARIVCACAVLHNFIRQYDKSDHLFRTYKQARREERTFNGAYSDSGSDADSDSGGDESPDEDFSENNQEAYVMRADDYQNFVRDEICNLIAHGVYPQHFQ